MQPPAEGPAHAGMRQTGEDILSSPLNSAPTHPLRPVTP